jgi:hypothetical protein
VPGTRGIHSLGRFIVATRTPDRASLARLAVSATLLVAWLLLALLIVSAALPVACLLLARLLLPGLLLARLVASLVRLWLLVRWRSILAGAPAPLLDLLSMQVVPRIRGPLALVPALAALRLSSRLPLARAILVALRGRSLLSGSILAFPGLVSLGRIASLLPGSAGIALLVRWRAAPAPAMP